MIILGFETTEHLFESENSIIYRARPLTGPYPVGSNVVLKVLKGDHPSPQRLARFRREFATASLFQSPRILKVFQQQSLTNSLISVVEDFGADSLNNCIKQKQLSLQESLTIALSLCDALADIHHVGIIHKDICPANILWNRATNTVKLTGFGVSMPIERTLALPYAPGVLEGTLFYMSPEQTGRMNRPVDFRSDFYSLGVTLYELFTGEKPFTSEDPLELIHCHIAKRPAPPNAPEALSDIVLKLMEKNAEDRYQSTEGIKADLTECLRQLESDGAIGRISRGSQDVSSRFQLSAKLYGREHDVSILRAAFERVLAGETAFTLVEGFSGVGKSCLVQELYRPVAVARGRYVAGKYDQFQRSIPCSAIGQALSSFCDQLLCESPEVVRAWRRRILSVVGKNSGAIVELIPCLENIIGPQPPPPEREPQAAENLLKLLCQEFFQAICRPEEPLVMFLDDLQWADLASLALLKTVLTNPRLRGLHLVGAYRDNEVDLAHPLMLLLNDIKLAGITFTTIHLDSLSYDNVGAFLADTLALTVPEVAELAQFIYSKTHGNAFFTTEFLKALYADGLLTFDTERRRWQWDAAGIHARQITDNVVTLMAGRIALLPKPTQNLLVLAACIGSQFHLETLEVIAPPKGNQPRILESLTPALRLGIVVSDDARTQGSLNDLDLAQGTFRFQHDRVQQAAYSLIPEAERPAVHLHIARQLFLDARRNDDPNNDLSNDLGGSLFEIVSHFNKGVAGMVDRDERLQAARLNLQAGRKARKAAAYHAAQDHFRLARELLPVDCFDCEYDLAFEIHLGLAKSSFVAGKGAESEALYPILLERARTLLDKSRVHLVQMDDYHLQGDYRRAIDVQKKNLALLGEQVPKNEHEFAAAIDRELRLTPQ